MNPKSPTKSFSDDEDDDLFYFESDHLALKGNKDYSEVLKTIFVLESQRAKAVKDYDTVVELQKQALNDPDSFIQKLKDGQSLGVPDLQIIAEVPNIHWSKYKVPLPEEGLKFINTNNSHQTEIQNFTERENNLRESGDTHNKPWTTEEQRRLEELLIIYPPEAIEFRRFKKIAAALGNRTVKQVSSRVQKYFIKLYKAGLPIPGRIPKYAERTKKSKLHIHQRFNHYLFKPTTFFPQLDIPVTMNESEEVPGPSRDSTSTSFTNYLIPDPAQPDVEQSPLEEPRTDVDRQLEILRRVKYEKQNENSVQSMFRHFEFRCDYCGEEPIVGTRWHCLSCASESIDFCSDCVVSQMYSGNAHPVSHKLEPIRYKNDAGNAGGMYSDSSSDSVSGSAFDSSNKNFESSNDMSTSGSDEEPCDETQNSPENDELETLKYEQEDDDEEDANDFSNYKTEINKTEGTFEEDNLKIEYDIDQESINENYMKQEVYILNEDGDLEETVDEDMDQECSTFQINNCMLLDENSVLETQDCNSTEENIDVTQCDDRFNSDIFTDTQNVSYSYLHSNLLLDNTL